MSCEAFEKLVALDAGGDLTPAETARLAAHLETCAPCRELAASIGESQARLKALAQVGPDEAGLDEDAVVRWRRGLLARIEAEPRRRILGWRWAWAAAAAMALVALVLVPRSSKPPLAHVLPPASARANGLPHPQPPAVVETSPLAHALPPASARTNGLPHPQPPAVVETSPLAHALPPASARPSRPPNPQPPATVSQRLPRHRLAPAPAPAAEPLLVKLETSDPNVVIYWFVDRKGN